VEALVIALEALVLRGFLHGFPDLALARRNGLGPTLGLDGANQSFRGSVDSAAVAGSCLGTRSVKIRQHRDAEPIA
jgi:hypothetical protein